jgi:hypothetical protein
VYEKWNASTSKWEKMNGMDVVQFEGVMGGSVDSITFKGSPEEIRQQELLYKSKQNDIYKANSKHDPKSPDYGGKDASVEPPNAQLRWSNRRYYDKKYWWTIEGSGKNVVYTRFSPDNTGGYHYSGSSDGVNNWQEAVPLEIPAEVIEFGKLIIQ